MLLIRTTPRAPGAGAAVRPRSNTIRPSEKATNKQTNKQTTKQTNKQTNKDDYCVHNTTMKHEQHTIKNAAQDMRTIKHDQHTTRITAQDMQADSSVSCARGPRVFFVARGSVAASRGALPPQCGRVPTRPEPCRPEAEPDSRRGTPRNPYRETPPTKKFDSKLLKRCTKKFYSGSCRCAIIGVPWCLRRLSLFSTCQDKETVKQSTRTTTHKQSAARARAKQQ